MRRSIYDMVDLAFVALKGMTDDQRKDGMITAEESERRLRELSAERERTLRAIEALAYSGRVPSDAPSMDIGTVLEAWAKDREEAQGALTWLTADDVATHLGIDRPDERCEEIAKAVHEEGLGPQPFEMVDIALGLEVDARMARIRAREAAVAQNPDVPWLADMVDAALGRLAEGGYTPLITDLPAGAMCRTREWGHTTLMVMAHDEGHGCLPAQLPDLGAMGDAYARQHGLDRADVSVDVLIVSGQPGGWHVRQVVDVDRSTPDRLMRAASASQGAHTDRGDGRREAPQRTTRHR